MSAPDQPDPTRPHTREEVKDFLQRSHAVCDALHAERTALIAHAEVAQDEGVTQAVQAKLEHINAALAAWADAALDVALAALLREYTGGAYIALNQNRDAMVREGTRPGASGGDVIRAGLGDWPESFLSTRRDLVDDVRAAATRFEVDQ